MNQHSRRFLDHRIPPPVVGVLVATAMWFGSHVGPSLPLADTPRHVIAGLLAAAGIAFDLLGLLAFRAARTTINPLRPGRASALVVSGVYRYTRNPMYVGMACLLLAWAVLLSAMIALAGPVIFGLFITRFQIVPEEQVLEALFGEHYRQYAARVRRWL